MVVNAPFRTRVALSTSDVGPHEMGELLYELPGVPRTSSREPFLDDLDGLDSQGKVGGDGDRSFVDDGAA